MNRRRLVLILIASAASNACSEAPSADVRTRADARAQVAAEAPPPPPRAIEGLRPIALRVPDMSCRLCARPIEHNLRKIGVQDVKADLDTKWVTGRFDPERLTPEAIRDKVEKLRFGVTEVRVD